MSLKGEILVMPVPSGFITQICCGLNCALSEWVKTILLPSGDQVGL